MKKFLATIALCISCISAISIVPVYAEDSITVNYEGNTISFDTAPFLENGTTMIPMRAIAEKMGAEVLWSPSSKVATIKRGQDILEIPAGGTVAEKWRRYIVRYACKSSKWTCFCAITFCRRTIRLKCSLG